jgi:gamma-glutamyltranspeptidase/glutathione hydrolase
MIDFDLDPQEAINVPHYMNRNFGSSRTDLEQPIPGITWDYDAEALAVELRERGHSNPSAAFEDREVGIIAQTSGLSIIKVEKRRHGYHFGYHYGYYFKPKTVLIGGADKRRDGTVGGH